MIYGLINYYAEYAAALKTLSVSGRSPIYQPKRTKVKGYQKKK